MPWSRDLPVSAAIVVALAACGAPPPAAPPTPPPALPAAAPAPAPAAPPVVPPVVRDGLTRFGGIRFRLPSGWSFKAEKDIAVGRSPSGDAGFLIGVGSLDHSVEVLHQADAAFGVHFPVGLGQLTQFNRLKLVLNKESAPAPGGQVMNLSVLMGKGPTSEWLGIFVFVKAPAGTRNEEVAAWAMSLDVDAP